MGLGGLGDQPGGDRFNIVSNNVCRVNGQHGIFANGGGSNLITGNVCIDMATQLGKHPRYRRLLSPKDDDILDIMHRYLEQLEPPKR